MYRFLLRPKWIAFTLLLVGLVVLMISLGFWQLRRLDERQQFNALVTSNTSQPLAPLADVLSPGSDISAVEWRPVTATGTYLDGQQVLVVNRSQTGETGRNVVDPLQLSDGSVLLVNRGFASDQVDVPPPPTGTVTITGVLRRSEERRLGQPEDASGVVLTEIRRIDIAKLSPQIGAPVQPMYVEASVTDSESLAPIASPTLTEGPHLSYAIQWFIFSACVVAGWAFAVRRSAAQRSGRAPRRRSTPPIADEMSRVAPETSSAPPG